ncbi:hypothetical protein [Variovorax paradoxus]|uniref:hypothetical protein n=1 Tax=Variovorax paradoxus TaxID=34073 RepID=UPI001931C1A0|nr:hypothetical protein INQ48_43570 [Variovorax paradoxus]
MNKTRYNRQYIANLAISTLVPLIKARGKLEAGNARQPAYRMLEAYGLEMLWIEKRPPQLDGALGQSSLEIWTPGVGKSLFVVWAPLQIVGFRGGPWVDTLVEIALQTQPDRAISDGVSGSAAPGVARN